MRLDESKGSDARSVSPESEFRNAASRLLSQYWLVSPDNHSEMNALWEKFWTLARNAGRQAASNVIPSTVSLSYLGNLEIRKEIIEEGIEATDKDPLSKIEEIKARVEEAIQMIAVEREAEIQSLSYWREELHLRTIDGSWQPFSLSLLPGRIVPADGSRDCHIAIDLKFHEKDLALLKDLGVIEVPREGYELSLLDFSPFLHSCRDEYRGRDDLPHKNPRVDKLNFATRTTSGPLEVLKVLSDEGNARYTWDLLDMEDTYKKWMMAHDGTQVDYPSMEFDSPALYVLREHGRIRTDAGIQKLSAGLGLEPEDPDVLNHLRQHPNARLIRHAFDLEAASDATVDPLGEVVPIPLLDYWPGLKPHLTQKEANLQLIRCDDLKNRTGRIDGTITDSTVYIARRDDDREELRVVLRELGLQLREEQVERVFLRETPADIQAARDKIRACSTDEERLLAAVGEADLKKGLPKSLTVAVLEQTHKTLTGEQIAQAAIATYHTGALREYKDALKGLAPPTEWAGRSPTVEFVRTLGFEDEWAGERNTRRDSYIDVEGPYSLPPLHDYQRKIVVSARSLIQSDGAAGERRGLISMPTGSGKTRVAVQAIVEAIRCDGFKGGILWVADRDELCEQAVESWRQVWSRKGVEATQLRIYRMWAGQPPPSPTGEMHVIVATIQTLAAKIKQQHESYDILSGFNAYSLR